MFKIQKADFPTIISILQELELTPFESAIRNKIIEKVRQAAKESQEVIDDISSQYIPKDEGGKPIWVVGRIVDRQIVEDPDGEPIPNAWICPPEKRAEYTEQVNLELADLWELVTPGSTNAQNAIKSMFSLSCNIKVNGDKARVLQDIQEQLGFLDDVDF